MFRYFREEQFPPIYEYSEVSREAVKKFFSLYKLNYPFSNNYIFLKTNTFNFFLVCFEIYVNTFRRGLSFFFLWYKIVKQDQVKYLLYTQ